jgi:hypothetical protein
VAATCEFGLWDQPDKQSLAERILTVQGQGAISVVSSSRLAYSTPNADFNYDLFEELFKVYPGTGRLRRLGDAVMLAKASSRDRTNSEKFTIFGDPTIRVAAPTYNAEIDHIEPDSIQALSKMTIQGHVEKNGASWNDFNGEVLIRVFDSRKERVFVTSPPFSSSVRYMLPGNSIFRGVASVDKGTFELEYIVPKDISYGGADGRISLYFWGEGGEGTGAQKGLTVGGTAVDLVDQKGPDISIHFGRSDFSDGDFTSPDPNLHVEIADSLSGVNIAGDIGHQITLVLDDNQANPRDITEYFQYHKGSYTAGTLVYPLYNLAEGQHSVRVKAWDNSNNSSVAERQFVVVSDTDLRLRNVLTYPNPMSDNTTFSYELSQDAMVSLKIYSLSGRVLRKFEPVQGQIGFNLYPEQWDGRDQDGDLLANGVYLYKIHATSASGEEQSAESIGKLIVAR